MSAPTKTHAKYHRLSGQTLCGVEKWVYDVQLRGIDAKEFSPSAIRRFMRSPYRCPLCTAELRKIQKEKS